LKHTPTEIPAIAENIMQWYDQSGRHLPWRNLRNPYAIWLSEVILQQTRVDQGLKYWERFLEVLPTVEDLASAPESQIKGLWSGLGYYRRADLLHRGSKQIASTGWPKGYAAWLEVPGIGPYTAAALASIVDGEVVPALDGNAYRVYSRIADWSEPIETARSKAFINSFALNQLHPKRPGDFNQAVMDLAQALCTPKKPKCSECPVQEMCAARRAGSAELRPVKTRTLKVIEHDLHFGIPRRGPLFGLVRRPVGGIWSGLYTLPELATVPAEGTLQVLDHRLSHRKLRLHFYSEFEGSSEPEIWLTREEWNAHGMPQAFVHWLTKFPYI
jgi:A/G-specific adenine glycosylase